MGDSTGTRSVTPARRSVRSVSSRTPVLFDVSDDAYIDAQRELAMAFARD